MSVTNYLYFNLHQGVGLNVNFERCKYVNGQHFLIGTIHVSSYINRFFRFRPLVAKLKSVYFLGI